MFQTEHARAAVTFERQEVYLTAIRMRAVRANGHQISHDRLATLASPEVQAARKCNKRPRALTLQEVINQA